MIQVNKRNMRGLFYIMLVFALLALASIVVGSITENKLNKEIAKLKEQHNNALVDLAIERVSHQTTTNMCLREIEYWQLKAGVAND